jgi:hypothetical protein
MWVPGATAVTAFEGSAEVVAAAADEGAVDVFEVEDFVDRTVAYC